MKNIDEKLEEAKKNRDIARIRFEAHTLILNGQKDTLKHTEEVNSKLIDELAMAVNNVIELVKEKESISKTMVDDLNHR